MAEILLVGAFGQRNVGDEALCRALSRALRDHAVVIASRDPERTRTDYGRPAIPATPRAVARAIRRANAVVVGGGTLFKTLHPASGRRPTALLRNTVLLMALARLHRVPVALVGVGAAELRGALPRRLARHIVPHADLLVLRDEESAAVLTDAGAEPPFWIGADPAWLLFDEPDVDATPVVRPRPNARNGNRGRRVTVAVSHLATGSDRTHSVEPSALELGLAGRLAQLADGGWHVRLQPWQAGAGDLQVAERLRARVPSAEIVGVPGDLQEAAVQFADDDLVVAMRFHALVAAGAARRRIVTIAHEPKLAGLARRLGQIAVPADASPAVLASALDWAVSHAPVSDDAVARQIELARHTVELLRILVAPNHIEHPQHIPALQLSDGEGRW